MTEASTTTTPTTEAPTEAAPAVEAAAADAAPEQTEAEPTALEQAAAANPEDEPAERGEPEADGAAEVPESYEIAPIEGVTFDETAIAEATPVFKELGLSNEQANKLVPIAASMMKRAAEAQDAQIAQARADWLKEAKEAPDIGRGEWDKSLSLAAKGLDRLGFGEGSPFLKLLSDSGLGNHPDMIRAWRKVGELVSEDTVIRSETEGAQRKSDAELFYPGQSPK